MNRFLLLLLLCVSYITINAQSLGIIESETHTEIHDLFNNKNITVHFYKDDFAIISGEYKGNLQYSLLEKNGFDNNFKYFIHYTSEAESTKLKKYISDIGDILYNNSQISILKIRKESIKQFKPLKSHALIYFDEKKAFLPDTYKSKFSINVSYNQDIASILEEINTDSIEATISLLSSFTTRDCYSDQVINALNWIDTKFSAYGLSVTTQNLSDYSVPSFNVIATQTGTTNPDEYVVVGGHADSRTSDPYDPSAPGADDNASGVAGVLEIARILSQSSFDRTIIYCAFSGEEYGLFGSDYFANQFRNSNKNIIGYVNLDMIGYKDPSQSLHTSLIYPSQAQYLADYYKNICSTYLPDFTVIDGTIVGGDSDHTSFNNAGYMGIFPFEDDQNYSPYIHSNNDILGLSVNCLELAENLTSAALATIASLANSNINLSNNNDLADSDYFKIYPNPATTDLNISVDGQNSIEVEIYNILGKIMIKETITGSDKINVSNLIPGTYFVKLNSEKNSTVKKFIIKRPF